MTLRNHLIEWPPSVLSVTHTADVRRVSGRLQSERRAGSVTMPTCFPQEVSTGEHTGVFRRSCYHFEPVLLNWKWPCLIWSSVIKSQALECSCLQCDTAGFLVQSLLSSICIVYPSNNPYVLFVMFLHRHLWILHGSNMRTPAGSDEMY